MSIRTTCAYCGVGCGLIAEGTLLRGDADHPANFGALCSKGRALGETLGLEDRLLYPKVFGKRASWADALSLIASKLGEIPPERVGFYLSGQLTTEDYYVANKLAKGFVGTSNVDTNSRLCMAASVAGQSRAFGADLTPGSYEDLDKSELVVLAGSNAAWCHPILFDRMRKNGRIIVIDPRLSATAKQADMHLPLRPGSDGTLFVGLLSFLAAEGRLDESFLKQHTSGFVAPTITIEEVADRCELDREQVLAFYREFADTERVVTAFSQGIQQSTSGTDKVSAILQVHLATGRIGKVGCGPFSLTGQPNAMGGREVGGFCSTLAAHMGFEEHARVGRFWGAPSMTKSRGLSATELFDAAHKREIDVLWIACTNPIVSLPDADRVREAIERCPLVIVNEVMADTEVTRLADVVLPALAWGEKDGTVTNSERRISRQRAFLPAPGEARADWEIFADVGRRLGHEEAFSWPGTYAVFNEHAALSAFENGVDGGPKRFFNLGALSSLNRISYDSLTPVQWPVPVDRPRGTARLFGDGEFNTEDGKATWEEISPRGPAHNVDKEHSLVLNTGRLRDQWHTMTRTGLSARLCGEPEPFVEVHPDNAEGLEDGSLAKLTTRWGSMIARVKITTTQRPGSVFVPIHWSSVRATRGRVGPLISSAIDPISHQPEFKNTPVRIEAWRPAWQGFVLSRRRREVLAEYQVEVRVEKGYRYELAGTAVLGEYMGGEAETLRMHDRSIGRRREVWLEDGMLIGCLFIEENAGSLPPREWLSNQLGQKVDDRLALLAGRAPLGLEEGPIVCACEGVGRATIERCIESGKTSLSAIATACGAGASCGGCVVELRELLDQGPKARYEGTG